MATKTDKKLAQMFEPLRDNVLLRPEGSTKEEKKIGSIIVPTTVNEGPPQIGYVIAVGPGLWENGAYKPVGLRAGDKVLYGRFAGAPLELDGEELFVIRSHDIMGIINAD